MVGGWEGSLVLAGQAGWAGGVGLAPDWAAGVLLVRAWKIGIMVSSIIPKFLSHWSYVADLVVHVFQRVRLAWPMLIKCPNWEVVEVVCWPRCPGWPGCRLTDQTTHSPCSPSAIAKGIHRLVTGIYIYMKTACRSIFSSRVIRNIEHGAFLYKKQRGRGRGRWQGEEERERKMDIIVNI